MGFILQSLRAYGLVLTEGDTGPQVQQKGELPVTIGMGPTRMVRLTTLGMLQRARRRWLNGVKSSLVGVEHWDPGLSREQARALEDSEYPVWRLIQSGQCHTSERAARLVLVEDDTCFLS